MPNTLQSLTFGSKFNESLERVTLPKQSEKFDFWTLLQPEFGTRDVA